MPMPSSRKATTLRRSAVIFDRDGVLNVDHGYVGEPERLEWVDGARRAIRRLNEAGVLVLVATNQSGVARGMFDLAAVDAVHAVMQADLSVEGARIDAFYVCPYLADAKDPAFAHPDHPDRKPNPGMLLRAMDEWGIDPARCLMIGDKASDMEAARRAGIAGALFVGGNLDDFVRPLTLKVRRTGETKRNAKLVAQADAAP
jgi:D-glycero-D-manno-heptose 1,7-bisphosphate phosphatase